MISKRFRSNSLRAMVLTVMQLAAGSSVVAQTAADLVQPKLLADVAAIESGKPFTVAVQLKMAPRWHIYWINPGDAGIPTTVKFELPEGFTVSKLEYPTPVRLEQTGGIIMYGYADQVMLLATITPPAKASTANVPIAATVKYLVCDDSCIPGEARLSLSLPSGAAKPSADADAIAKWKRQVPTPFGQVKAVASQTLKFDQSPTRKSEGKISLKIEWNDAPPAKLSWFPPASDALIFTDIKTETQGKTTTVTAAVQRLTGQKIDPSAMDSVLAHDASDGRVGIAIPIQFPAEAGS